VLSGTATAGQILQSGSSAAPSWSTTTYPATNAANTLLYASSANTMAALATANSGVLITSAGGVPSISSTLPAAVQGNITSTGTIASGVWNGTAVDVAHGGTGNTSTTAYAVLCGGTTSTGVLQPIASVGTSGQVLTSNGAGALPTFQAAGGSLTKIASGTASNSASIEFTNIFSSSYSNYLFVFNKILPATNNVGLYAQLGTGAGPTYVTTGYNWANATMINGGSISFTNSTSDAQIGLTDLYNSYGINNAGNGVNGNMQVLGTNGTSNIASGNFNYSTILASSSTYLAPATDAWTLGAAVYTAIKFYMSSGNIASGTITVYGYTP
jgi:hypothetical protein